MAEPLGEEDPTSSHGALPSSPAKGIPRSPAVSLGEGQGGVYHPEPQFPHLQNGFMLLLTLLLLAAVRFNKLSGGASAEVGLSTCVMTLHLPGTRVFPGEEGAGHVHGWAWHRGWDRVQAPPPPHPREGDPPHPTFPEPPPNPRDVSLCAQSLNRV